MSDRIFISYRRSDQAGFAGRLFDRINADPELEEAAFMDVEGVAAGHDFEQVLPDHLGGCDVVLAIIGDRWHAPTDTAGSTRLHLENDIVRRELTDALSMGKHVIPVLIDSSQHPRADELPESLRPLANCQSLQLTHRHFDADASRIVNAVKLALAQAESSRAAKKKRTWERASFLKSVADTRDPATSQKMASIIDWALGRPIGFKWGSGQKYGSFMLASQTTGQTLLYVYGTGDCHVYLANLEKSGILPDLEAREQALRKLNSVPGILMPLQRAKDQYPAFQIAQVDLANIPRLIDVLGEILKCGPN